MNGIHSKDIKRSQLMYICEAALEYLISILVSGSFLATLTRELGLSDSLTGILSSIISLGCIFQMISMFIHRKQMKGFVLVMSITNQLMFMFLYVIPVIKVSDKVKTILFVILIFVAYFIYNIAYPKKTYWLMSLVDDNLRGIFTANKEIVSLISGMVFTYIMGMTIDYYTNRGEVQLAMIVSATVIFILMLFHTLTMMMIPEIEKNQTEKKDMLRAMKEVIGNKNIVRVTVITVLYYISTYVATPFYGTYQIEELDFSLKVISGLSIMSNTVRIAVSRFWGRYADKTSFSNMLQKCLLIIGCGYLCATFAVPENGLIMFGLYYLFQGIALGGINSALVNLIYDNVVIEKRADSLALCQATGGIAGFTATLLASTGMAFIQNNGNHFLGINVYAQQIVSVVAFVIVLFAFVYVKMIAEKRPFR